MKYMGVNTDFSEIFLWIIWNSLTKMLNCEDIRQHIWDLMPTFLTSKCFFQEPGSSVLSLLSDLDTPMFQEGSSVLFLTPSPCHGSGHLEYPDQQYDME